jgi:hypothetical protein
MDNDLPVSAALPQPPDGLPSANSTDGCSARARCRERGLRALGQRLAEALAADGIVPLLMRSSLAGLYIGAAARELRDGYTAAGAPMALVFVTIWALALRNWREALLVMFAPDASLWRPAHGVGWQDRLSLAVCRHAALWFFTLLVFLNVPWFAQYIVPLPLLASCVEHLVQGRRRRAEVSTDAASENGYGVQASQGVQGIEPVIQTQDAPSCTPIVQNVPSPIRSQESMNV